MLKMLALLIIIQVLLLPYIHGIQSSMNIVGKDCKLTDPIYNYTFDLNVLNIENMYKIQISADPAEFIEFNVCGPIFKSCNGLSHTSACYTKNGIQTVLGAADYVLSLTDGLIHFNFNYTNGNGNKTYALELLLECDYSIENTTSPFSIKPKPDDECTFHVVWRTPHACLPLPKEFEKNECTVKDKISGAVFDLMPLSHFNHRISYENGSSFIINVCKPVLYRQNEMCPIGSSICFSNDTEIDLHKKFINYGSTQSNPKYEKGKLFMHFPTNEKCSKTHNISSTMQFTCDSTLEYGEPKFVKKVDCEYQFEWPTSFACNKNQSCLIIDPATGFMRYNLTTLSHKQYKVTAKNHTYVFGICSDVKTTCEDSVGACEITTANDTKPMALGKFNDNLLFDVTGSPYLIYRSGAFCQNISQQWHTRIEFICEKNASKHEPYVIENTNCELVIHFLTNLVCEKELTCKALVWKDKTEIDLTPLMNKDRNYLARVNDTVKQKDGDSTLYYLNVCRPLALQYGLSCKGQSAACRAIKGSSTPTDEKSLGFADASLTVIDTDFGPRAQLKYLRGDVCHTDETLELSSSIEFYCNASAGKGTPILQQIVDCHYRFEWPTNVICPKSIGQFHSNTCELYNNDTCKTFDLKSITKNGIITVNPKSSTPFDVNVCGGDGNGNNNRNVEIDYAQGTTKIFFAMTNGPCRPDGKVKVELRLVCKENESDYNCGNITSCDAGLVIIKETPLICRFIGDTTIQKENSKPSITNGDNTAAASLSTSNDIASSGFSFLIAVFSAIAFIMVVIGLGYIIKSPERCAKCRSLFSRRTVSVQYTRARNDDEDSLLLVQPGRLDSDDDLLT